MKAIRKTIMPVLSLALALGLAHPAAAGLLSGVTGGAQGAASGTASGGAFSGGNAGAHGTLDSMMGTTGRATNTTHGAFDATGAASRDGALSHTIGTLNNEGRVTSLDVYGDDMMNVRLKDDLKDDKAAASDTDTTAGTGRHVPLGSAGANAAMNEAVSLDGVPQARSVRAGDDGAVTLGAEESDGAVQVKTHAAAAAGIHADPRAAARRLPVHAGASREGAHADARFPGNSAARADLRKRDAND